MSLFNDLYYTPEGSVGTGERENREGTEGDRRVRLSWPLFMQIFKNSFQLIFYFDELFLKK